MGTFDDREKGFEAKHVHDEQTQFKIGARRNKLLGLWAAELMGMGKDQADAFAREVVSADFDEAGDEDVYRKVAGDLTARKIEITEHRIRRKMVELLEVAREQVLKG